MKHISGATVLGLSALFAALSAPAQTTHKAEKPLVQISSQDGKLSQPTGPFGFYFGETRDQVIAAVGKPAILTYNENALRLSTAPKPYPGFDSYTLVFSPTTNGIICVSAHGERIRVNDEGDQLKAVFHSVEDGLVSVYGAPSHQFDTVPAGAEAEPQFWMMSLLHEERELFTVWDSKRSPMPNHLTKVLLEAEAADIEHGSIEIFYYFEGLCRVL
jgi:hypothetical protein